MFKAMIILISCLLLQACETLMFAGEIIDIIDEPAKKELFEEKEPCYRLIKDS